MSDCRLVPVSRSAPCRTAVSSRYYRTLFLHFYLPHALSPGWSLGMAVGYVRERVCCGRSYLWLCLSASEVEELQNPLLIAKPAGFRCLARYLVPSGRSRVSRGLTHRLRDDLGGRRSSHVVDRLMGFIRQFHPSPDVGRRDKFPGLLRVELGNVKPCTLFLVLTVTTEQHWER